MEDDFDTDEGAAHDTHARIHEQIADLRARLTAVEADKARAISAAVAAEREACAKIVDDWHKEQAELVQCAGMRFHIAAAIRARTGEGGGA